MSDEYIQQDNSRKLAQIEEENQQNGTQSDQIYNEKIDYQPNVKSSPIGICITPKEIKIEPHLYYNKDQYHDLNKDQQLNDGNDLSFKDQTTLLELQTQLQQKLSLKFKDIRITEIETQGVKFNFEQLTDEQKGQPISNIIKGNVAKMFVHGEKLQLQMQN